jgi:FkbM family methyltransferase
VIAFEPIERNASLIELSIAENKYGDRVLLERLAVTESTCSVEIISPKDTNNWGGAFINTGRTKKLPGHNLIRIPAVRLDEYAFQKRPISFIKIDIEGAEPFALRGAKNILRNDRPVILSEVHPGQLAQVAGITPNDFLNQMKQYGYNCHEIQNGSVADKIETYDADRVITVVYMPHL